MRRTEETTLVALVKGKERYVWLFEPSHTQEALRSFGRFASDPDLSFTWGDAAKLSSKLMEHRS